MFIHFVMNKLTGVLAMTMLSAVFFLFSSSASATGKSELEKVQHEIKNHQKVIQEKQDNLEALQKQLAKDEKEFNNINKKLKNTKQKLRNSKEKLNKLLEQQQKLLKEKNQQLDQLSKQITEAYKIGSSDYLKIILNQEDPNTIGRTLEYHAYINRARIKAIQNIESLISELSKNQQSIESNNQELNRLVENHHNEAQILHLRKTQKEKTAESIKLNLKREEQKLLKLKDTEKRLLQEIAQNQKRIEEENRRKEQEEIAQAKAKADKEGTSTKEAEEKTLARLQSGHLKGLLPSKGKLPWPLNGKIIKRFGDSRAGELTWTGILIKPNAPQVTSIADGNVVMAGPLDGYGIIIVVDHGDGYWSLYGNNRSVARSVGDRVKKGDILGYYNQNSSLLESSLYFEIRHKGKPLNPEKWLRRK